MNQRDDKLDAHSHEKRRILVVDDSPDNREAVADLLRFEGFEVAEAEDGASALLDAAKFRPHVFLLDVVMPGMSGLELLGKLRVKEHAYEAIMMTGHESLDDARKAMELGAVSYVGKPVKHEELMKHVRAALDMVGAAEFRNEYESRLERDVTVRTRELKLSVEIAESQSRRLDAIVEGMQEGLVALDRECRIVLLNPPGQKILGLDAGRALGSLLWDAVGDSDTTERLRAILDRTGEQASTPAEFRVSVNGGIARHYLVNVSELCYAPGERAGRIVIFSDITDRVEAERLRTSFLSVVAHEFRTPLGVIMSGLSVLASAELAHDGDLAESVADMHAAARRLVGLVNSVMHIVRLSESDVAPHRTRVDCRQIIAEEIRKQQRASQERNVRIVFIGEGEAIPVLTDGGLLGIAVGNVVDNAVKFCRTDGEVVVVCGIEIVNNLRCVIIDVKDQGPGVPDNVRGSLFVWFYQGEDSLTRAHGGIGVGLPVALRAAQLVGGTVELRSTGDGGSVFRVRIPAPDSSYETTHTETLVNDLSTGRSTS